MSNSEEWSRIPSCTTRAIFLKSSWMRTRSQFLQGVQRSWRFGHSTTGKNTGRQKYEGYIICGGSVYHLAPVQISFMSAASSSTFPALAGSGCHRKQVG